MRERCLPQFLQRLCEPLAAPALILRFVASRQAFQMRDQLVALRDTVGPDLPGYARPHDLLGPSWAYLQERL